MTLLHRSLRPEDAPVIAAFPQSAEELFHMFPNGVWPFTGEQLLAAAHVRWDATVVELAGRPCGYANFAAFEAGRHCAIGNVVVAPWARRQGVASFLIKAMIEKAFDGRGVPLLRVLAHASNYPALLLYSSLGFQPEQIEAVADGRGGTVPLVHFRMARG